MKKIIALSSFLLLLLLAVLPANVSHAAAAKTVDLKSITLFTNDGKTIEAEKKGNNFTFNLVGKNGKLEVNRIEFKSANATTLSTVHRADPDYSDDVDIRFANGVAYLDKEKYINWLIRVSEIDDEELLDLIKNDESFDLPTVKDLKYLADVGELPFFVADDNGNETEYSVTIKSTQWVKQNGKWYFIGPESNSMTDYATGWVDDNGTWYFMDKNGVMQTGWVKSGSKWYFLNPSGAMATGWVKDKNTWYYLNGNGAMATGWAKVGGKWYFLDASGAMKTGWVKTGGKWYFLNSSGAMATGWVKVSNKWYYLDGSGAMKTGWVKLSNKWYYLDGSGAMKTGWVEVSKKWYYLYSDGHMAANTKIGSYRVGADGAWIK
ncbi:hypothetical protein ACFVSW_09565 [Neobacillus sp. NPDC058068]|uniref:hypothetical protein n=1 Tax=Neobacillus sp. NPDC058068 TaxID=3346325 RepID=UPI0036D7C08C